MEAKVIGLIRDIYQKDASSPTYFKVVGAAGDFKFSTRATNKQTLEQAAGKQVVCAGTLKGSIFSLTTSENKRRDTQGLEWDTLKISAA